MGLDMLASLVEGGIPQGTSVLLSGSPGTGKTTLALQLIHDHLSRGGQGIVIATQAAPAQTLRQASLAGLVMGPLVGETLGFLDAYSWRAGNVADAKGIACVRALNDPSSLSIKLTEMIERCDPGRALLVVFDSPSTLTLHAPPAAILKLIEVVFAKVKSGSGSVLALVEREMHEETFLAALAAMADGVLHFRIVEEDDDLVRQMRVLSMRTASGVSSKWMRLGLSKQGLSLTGASAAAKG